MAKIPDKTWVRELAALGELLADGDVTTTLGNLVKLCSSGDPPIPLEPLIESLRLIQKIARCAIEEAQPTGEKAYRLAKGRYWSEPGVHRRVSVCAMWLARLETAQRLAVHAESQVQARALLKDGISLFGASPQTPPGKAIERKVRALRASLKAKPRRSAKRPAHKKLASRTTTALEAAKSLRRGTLSPLALVSLAELSPDDTELAEMAADMGSYDGDVFVVDGDLHVDGHFDTSEAACVWLVVRGNLTVEGLYRDTCNDAPDRVLVLGDLVARDVITAGRLEVRGNITASGVILGDYNDGSARVLGNVTANLYVPSDHAFEIRGQVSARYLVGSTAHVKSATELVSMEWDEVPFATAIEDAAALMKALRSGRAIF